MDSSIKKQKTSISKTIIGIVIVIILFILLSSFPPFTMVKSGYVGVPVKLGEVKNFTFSNGFHLKNPILSIVPIPVSIQRVPVSTEGASQDLQTVRIKATANYRLLEPSVPKLYYDFQKRYESELIVPSVLESIKSASAKLTAEKLIIDRATFRQGIITQSNEKLAKYGVVIEEISIEDIQFSQSFDEAIERKVTAEQDALTSKNKLEQIKYDAQQRIEQAKGEAEAIRIQAEAIRNQGGAEYVQLKAIEKWKGDVPTYNGGGAIPFINIR